MEDKIHGGQGSPRLIQTPLSLKEENAKFVCHHYGCENKNQVKSNERRVTALGAGKKWSLKREFLKQYLTEKQTVTVSIYIVVAYEQRSLKTVVVNFKREFTVFRLDSTMQDFHAVTSFATQVNSI